MFNKASYLKGMQTFTLIWFGQLVSLVGTAMTRFALLVWAHQQTGDATTIALLGFFSFAPYVVLSPLAGVVVDRLDRRVVMLCADFGAGLMTLLVMFLYFTGQLQVWHLYLLEGAAGAFEAFQIPAYTASITMLIPPDQRGRANGMRSIAEWAARVAAPVIAGLLLTVIDISGVMLIDVATFLIAVTTLFIVQIPRPQISHEGSAAHGHWRQEISFGVRYIAARRGLLGLVLVFMGFNFFGTLTYMAIMPAMILARSGGDEVALATVQAALGLGGLLGGVAISMWGIPRRRIHGIFLAAALSFLFGDFLFAVGRGTLIWAFAGFVSAFFIPYIFSSDTALWQAKVPPDVQGKVFSAQHMLRTLSIPVGYLLAGPLADRVFEPAMALGGRLSPLFGGLVGTGAGAGMALMFACTCICGTLTSLSGYLIPAVRRVEAHLPDVGGQSLEVSAQAAGD